MTKNLLLVISFIPLSLLAQKNNFYGGGYEANILERNFNEKSIALNSDGVLLDGKPTEKDSLGLTPSFDIYANWDTRNIHSYSKDLSRMEGEIDLALVKSNHDYCHPINGIVTSDFGYRSGKHHYGIDLRLKIGDPIFSAFGGVIRISKYSASYGNVMVVRHDNGLETLYAHLSKRHFSSGQRVKAGQKIGLGGNTGRSTGPHLHFECRYLGKPINPNDIIDFENGVLKGKHLSISRKTFSYFTKIKKKVYHSTKKGETLYAISRRYDVSVTNLFKMNGLSQKSTLSVGQPVRVR
ncbi:MAG: M23 family metallopeptidase [Flavobacteriales bacterium]|jgi:murein DD-endopeptidase MepM/ murein hydrolase activator NlpD